MIILSTFVIANITKTIAAINGTIIFMILIMIFWLLL